MNDPLDLPGRSGLLRSATAADLHAVVALAGRRIDAMRWAGIDQWDERYPTAETFATDIADHTLLILSGGDPVAAAVTINDVQDPEYAVLSWRDPCHRPLVVHRLMVDPTGHRRGLGRGLMTEVHRRAIASGQDVIRLDAFHGNGPANALDRSLGYDLAGTVRFRKGLFNGMSGNSPDPESSARQPQPRSARTSPDQ